MLFVLDSLGNLSTTKEMEDIADGKDTRDMTRAQLVRGAFRVLTLKLGKAKVPLIVTNHVYDVVGSYVPTKKMGGGSGLEYAASGILFLSKKKEKSRRSSKHVSDGAVGNSGVPTTKGEAPEIRPGTRSRSVKSQAVTVGWRCSISRRCLMRCMYWLGVWGTGSNSESPMRSNS